MRARRTFFLTCVMHAAVQSNKLLPWFARARQSFSPSRHSHILITTVHYCLHGQRGSAVLRGVKLLRPCVPVYAAGVMASNFTPQPLVTPPCMSTNKLTGLALKHSYNRPERTVLSKPFLLAIAAAAAEAASAPAKAQGGTEQPCCQRDIEALCLVIQNLLDLNGALNVRLLKVAAEARLGGGFDLPRLLADDPQLLADCNEAIDDYELSRSAASTAATDR